MAVHALCDVLLRNAAAWPDRVHLRSADREYTFAEAADLAGRLASLLRARPEVEGRREVGIAADDPMRTAICVWACVLGGLSVAFLPEFGRGARGEKGPLLVLTDKRDRLDREHTIGIEDALEEAAGHRAVEPEDAPECAFLFETSGTEGEPKSVRCTYRSVAAVLACMADHGALAHARDRTVFLTPPLYHSYGLSAFLEYTLVGGTVVFPSGTSPLGPVGDLRHPRVGPDVTAIEGVPYFHYQLSRLVDRLALPRLRHLGLGGGAVEREVIERILGEHPHLTVSVRYGLTETPSVVSHKIFHPPHAGDWESSGPILPIFEVAIHDEEGNALPPGREGEITVSGACIGEVEGMEPGRIRTRDLGYVSQGGELVVVGRRSAFLKLRGFRISPEALEAVARGWPAVRDCRFVQRDGKLRAEVVRGEAFEDSAFLAYLGRELPIHAIPDEIVPVEDIPRTASGKVKRHAEPA